MKMKKSVMIAIGFSMVAGLVTQAVAEEAQDEVMALTQTPAAVQATIRKQAAGSDIKQVEKGKDNGKVVYEVKVVKGGQKCDISVAPDGTLLGVEEEMTLADIPEAVRKTLAGQVGQGKVEKIERAVADGKTVFEAEIEKDGKDFEITIASDGKLGQGEELKNENHGPKGAKEEKD